MKDLDPKKKNKLYGKWWGPFEGKTREEWETIRKEWEATHPIRTWLKKNIWNPIYFPVWRYWDRIRGIPNNIKWFFQRGYRGWATCDVWGFYDYNAKVTYDCLKWLKEHKHGVPSGICVDGEPFEESIKRWEAMLDEMIYSFECLVKSGTAECEFWYPHPDFPDKHLLAVGDDPWFKKYPECHLMTKEEDDRYNEGMQLFIKHYRSLWD